jgi:hypothetical protein
VDLYTAHQASRNTSKKKTSLVLFNPSQNPISGKKKLTKPLFHHLFETNPCPFCPPFFSAIYLTLSSLYQPTVLYLVLHGNHEEENLAGASFHESLCLPLPSPIPLDLANLDYQGTHPGQHTPAVSPPDHARTRPERYGHSQNASTTPSSSDRCRMRSSTHKHAAISPR